MDKTIIPFLVSMLAVAGCVSGSAVRPPIARESRVPGYTTLIAHRGESYDAPENTLPAYRMAVERGFGFECDIYLSADGELFTFHDPNLTRTTNGANTNRCTEVEWNEVRQCNVGGWGKWKGSKYDGTRPAKFEEVLALARPGRKIYIEVKGGDSSVGWVESIRQALVRAPKANPDTVLFIAFGHQTCAELRRQLPEFKVYWLYRQNPKRPKSAAWIIDRLRECDATGVDMKYFSEIATEEYIGEILAAGFEFHCWTIDDPAIAAEALKRGAMSVTTNRARYLNDCNSVSVDSDPSVNPLLSDWSSTGGLPPFGEIRMEHVLPAYERAIADERKEISDICSQSAVPDYENTIRPLTLAGAKVERIRLLMVNYAASCLTPEVEKVVAAQAPILAERQSEVYSNSELFKRVEAVYAQREQLPTERRRVTEAIYRRFLHAGARLGPAERLRLKDIQSRLEVLSLSFIANFNAENAWFAREFGFDSKDIDDHLADTSDRALRERLYRAYHDRCRRNNEFDNRPVALEMLKLRHERAKLLGYRNSAEMLTEHTMAKTPERAMELMMRIERAGKVKVEENRERLRSLMERDVADGLLPAGTRFEPWDWQYYQKRLRDSEVRFSNSELKPYLPRQRVFEACFAAAREMYGITVEEVKDAPSFAPGTTETYRLRDADGSLLGTLVFDYRPRPTKHLGAWIEPFVYQFRDRDGVEVRPVASQAGSLGENFTLSNVVTVFHEFGHALHALCSRCEDATLSGLNGTHEYNEIFSQFNQELGIDRAYLLRYARNAAGEPLPEELLDRALADRAFGAAAKNIGRIGTSILDLRLHQLTDFENLDLDEYQRQVEREIGWIPELAIAYDIPVMRHVFVHGYEAGFFAYAWSRVMSEDLLVECKRRGGVREPAVAAEFRRIFLERGYSHDPEANFREFMGRDPDIAPYLQAVGFK